MPFTLVKMTTESDTVRVSATVECSVAPWLVTYVWPHANEAKNSEHKANTRIKVFMCPPLDYPHPSRSLDMCQEETQRPSLSRVEGRFSFSILNQSKPTGRDSFPLADVLCMNVLASNPD